MIVDEPPNKGHLRITDKSSCTNLFVLRRFTVFKFFCTTQVPPSGVAKVLHSPMDKENRPATPHSKWSPVRRKKPLNFEEACIRCTKKVK